MAWFMICIGLTLLAFGVPALLKGLRMSRKGAASFHESASVDAVLISGMVGCFAGLLPLALGIVQLFKH